ncbi:ABC transporter permease [Sediminispirochaeta smaragdinae]|uniref:Binding-protein-dependent transport systems inner membrane component n=1 Tax=Sediminispirochaeta smaragdinae (strain DSM 11293 / JCM 15392 / SEBR 4228) TaxID=573413 RepID=E1R4E0_SEDSS|nr:ABC transporter permease [Sediminispirochaeta smaragdinae]ADK81681.1 binding-protein-dependent transport systems inner membrane component [Sediminispirochaeta smaragdinae DSM 11293]
MVKYILKRVLFVIPVVLGISFFIFLIMSLAPGDPAQLILGTEASPAAIAAKRAELGLDDPLLVRYVNYMKGVVQGDFGFSWYNKFNVLSEFGARLPNTLTLGMMAMAISALVGIPLGIFAAVRQNSVFDYTSMVVAMIFTSMPSFWFGLMAQVYIALKLGWLPATGVGSLKHFVLPAITLAAAQLASQVRMTRTSILEVIKQDYVRTARSKGASERRVIIKHVLRNGLLPVITQLGLSFALLLGGAIVTETVFAIPGVASLLISAVKLRDVPVVTGIVIIIACFVGFANLLVDLLYAVVDPRVKHGYLS